MSLKIMMFILALVAAYHSNSSMESAMAFIAGLLLMSAVSNP